MAVDQDREGYVPNVVYTCGAVKHGDRLFVPYGVADSSVAFAFIGIQSLLEAMAPDPAPQRRAVYAGA